MRRKIATVPREVQNITNILHPENNRFPQSQNMFLKNTATQMNCKILHLVQTALTEKQLAPHHQDSVSGVIVLLIIRSQVDISIRVSSRQAWKCVSYKNIVSLATTYDTSSVCRLICKKKHRWDKKEITSCVTYWIYEKIQVIKTLFSHWRVSWSLFSFSQLINSHNDVFS